MKNQYIPGWGGAEGEGGGGGVRVGIAQKGGELRQCAHLRGCLVKKKEWCFWGGGGGVGNPINIMLHNNLLFNNSNTFIFHFF